MSSTKTTCGWLESVIVWLVTTIDNLIDTADRKTIGALRTLVEFMRQPPEDEHDDEIHTEVKTKGVVVANYDNSENGWLKPFKFVGGRETPPAEDLDPPPFQESDEVQEGAGIISEPNEEAAQCIAVMKCPKCGSCERFYVQAVIFIDITKHSISGNQMAWGKQSPCMCPGCGWEGIFAETQPKESD